MTKAVRRLTDINFECEGAHVALVSVSQGGPANGITTLITKATNTLPQEQVEKAAEVSVTMQFPEFLRRFFGLYWDDAEVLSVVLGYGRTGDEDKDDRDWIDERVESIKLMKSVYRAENVEEAFAALTPEERLAIRKDQAMFEEALANPAAPTIKPTEIPMETILKSAHVEAIEIEKAATALVQKALDEATAQLGVYKAAEATAKVEARKAALTDARVTAEQLEGTLAALAALSDEAFASTVATMKSLASVVDNSDLMQEAGVQGQGVESQEEEDRTTALLKAKYAPKA